MKSLFSAILIILLSTVCRQYAAAVPAPPYPIEVQCEDGSVRQVYVYGDERAHYYTDLQGRHLVRTDFGFRSATELEAAEMATSVAARRSGAPHVGASTFPTIGRYRLLVILVEFADNSFTIEDPYKAYTDFLTFPAFQPSASVKDYFIDVSYNQFVPLFDIYGPVKLSQPMAYYGGNKLNGDDIRPDEMVTEACAMLDDEIDFSVYDVDGDGVIDNVYVFYAGYGENDTGIRNAVWPHSWDIAAPQPDGAGRTVYFDGKLINHYACSNELRGGTTEMAGIGTFVHEFGHVLGLPDLYSTRRSSAFTPGAYSVMDQGSYNNHGLTPPYYSAYERYALGWYEPLVIDSQCDVELISPAQRIDGELAVIIPTTNPNEFYLVENRQQHLRDEFIPGHGMVIWHIDYDPDLWDQNIVNIEAAHQRIDLVEADGIQSSSTRAGDTFPGTADVTSFGDFRPWGGDIMDARITDIAETPEATVTFKFSGIAGVSDVVSDSNSSPIEYFDLQGRPVKASSIRPGIYLRRQGTAVTKTLIR